ncbi:hypothetical protein ACFO4E_08635 [Nocardiopsis mangrovi]|uniref:Uncharacterized protein n=1 Tax=Nocardiopsis mangrovi TaxID=1179818 RepID=A0ABV9DVL7_9ACTN
MAGLRVPSSAVIDALPGAARDRLGAVLAASGDPADVADALAVFAAGRDDAAGRGPLADVPAAQGRPAIAADDVRDRLDRWRDNGDLVTALRVLHDNGLPAAGRDWVRVLPDAGREQLLDRLLPPDGSDPVDIFTGLADLDGLNDLPWPVLEQAALDLVSARYDQLVHKQPLRNLTVAVLGHPELRLTQGQVMTQLADWASQGVLDDALGLLRRLHVPLLSPTLTQAAPTTTPPQPQAPTGGPASSTAGQGGPAGFTPVQGAVDGGDGRRNPATASAGLAADGDGSARQGAVLPAAESTPPRAPDSTDATPVFGPPVNHRPGDPAPRVTGLPDSGRWGDQSPVEFRDVSTHFASALKPPADAPPLSVEVDTDNGPMRAEVVIGNLFFESATIEIDPAGDDGPSEVRTVTVRLAVTAGDGADQQAVDAATRALRGHVEGLFNDAYVLPRSGQQLHVEVAEATPDEDDPDRVHATVTWHPVAAAADGSPAPAPAPGADGRGVGEVLRRLGMLDGDPERGVAEPYVARRTLDRIETMVEPRPGRRFSDPEGDAPAQVRTGLADPSAMDPQVWADARDAAQVHRVGGPHVNAAYSEIARHARAARPLDLAPDGAPRGLDDQGNPVDVDAGGTPVDPAQVAQNPDPRPGDPERFVKADMGPRWGVERRFEWRRIEIPAEHRTDGGPTHIREITYRPRVHRDPNVTQADYDAYLRRFANDLDALWNNKFRIRGDGSVVRPEDGAVVHRMGTGLRETLFGAGSRPDAGDLEGNAITVPGADLLPGAGDQFHVRLEFADDATPAVDVHGQPTLHAFDPAKPAWNQTPSTMNWYTWFPPKVAAHEAGHVWGLLDEYAAPGAVFRWGPDADAVRTGDGLMGNAWTDLTTFPVSQIREPVIRSLYLDTISALGDHGSSLHTPPPRAGELPDAAKTAVAQVVEPGLAADDPARFRVFDRFALATDRLLGGWDGARAADQLVSPGDAAVLGAVREHLSVAADARGAARREHERADAARAQGDDATARAAEARAAGFETAATAADARADEARGRAADTGAEARAADALRDFDADIARWRDDGRLARALDLADRSGFRVPSSAVVDALPGAARDRLGAVLAASGDPADVADALAVFAAGRDLFTGRGPLADVPAAQGRPAIGADDVRTRLDQWRNNGDLVTALRVLHDNGVPVAGREWASALPDARWEQLVDRLLPPDGSDPEDIFTGLADLDGLNDLPWPVLEQAGLDILGARYDEIVHNEPPRDITVTAPGHAELRLTQAQVTAQLADWASQGVLDDALRLMRQSHVPLLRPSLTQAVPPQPQAATGGPATPTAGQGGPAGFMPAQGPADGGDQQQHPATAPADPAERDAGGGAQRPFAPMPPAPRVADLPGDDAWGVESEPEVRKFSSLFADTLKLPEGAPPLAVEVDTPGGRMRAEVEIDNRFFESVTMEIDRDGAGDGGPSSVRNVKLRFAFEAGPGVDTRSVVAASAALRDHVQEVFNDAYVLPRSGQQLNVEVVRALPSDPPERVHATVTWHPVAPSTDGSPSTDPDGQGTGEVLRRLGMLDGDPARGVAEPYVARQTLERIETMSEPRPSRRWSDPEADRPAAEFEHKGLVDPNRMYPPAWEAARARAQVHQVGGPHVDADVFDVRTDARAARPLDLDGDGNPVGRDTDGNAVDLDANGQPVDPSAVVDNPDPRPGDPKRFIKADMAPKSTADRRFEHRRIEIPEEYRKKDGPTHIREVTFRPRLRRDTSMTVGQYNEYRREYAESLAKTWNTGFRLRGEGEWVQGEDGRWVSRPGRPGTGDQFHVRLEFADATTPADQVHADITLFSRPASGPEKEWGMSQHRWNAVFPVEAAVHETGHYFGLLDTYFQPGTVFRGRRDADAVRPGDGYMGNNWLKQVGSEIERIRTPEVLIGYLDSISSVMDHGSSAHPPSARAVDLPSAVKARIVKTLEPAAGEREHEVFEHFALASDQFLRGWDVDRVVRQLVAFDDLKADQDASRAVAHDAIAGAASSRADEAREAFRDDVGRWQEDGRLARALDVAGRNGLGVPSSAVIAALPDSVRTRLGAVLAGSTDPVAVADTLAVLAAGRDHTAGRGPVADIPAAQGRSAISADDVGVRLEQWRGNGELVAGLRVLHDNGLAVTGGEWFGALSDASRARLLDGLLPSGRPRPGSVLENLGPLPRPVLERVALDVLGAKYDTLVHRKMPWDSTVSVAGPPEVRLAWGQVIAQLQGWQRQGVLDGALNLLSESGIPLSKPVVSGSTPVPAGSSGQQPAAQGRDGAVTPVTAGQDGSAGLLLDQGTQGDGRQDPATALAEIAPPPAPGTGLSATAGPSTGAGGAGGGARRPRFLLRDPAPVRNDLPDLDLEKGTDRSGWVLSQPFVEQPGGAHSPLSIEMNSPRGRMRAQVEITTPFFASSVVEIPGENGADSRYVRQVVVRLRVRTADEIPAADADSRSAVAAATAALQRRMEAEFNARYVLPHSGDQLHVSVVPATPGQPFHATVTWSPVPPAADGSPAPALGPDADGRGAGDLLQRLGLLDSDPAQGRDEPFVARQTLERIENAAPVREGLPDFNETRERKRKRGDAEPEVVYRAFSRDLADTLKLPADAPPLSIEMDTARGPMRAQVDFDARFFVSSSVEVVRDGGHDGDGPASFRHVRLRVRARAGDGMDERTALQANVGVKRYVEALFNRKYVLPHSGEQLHVSVVVLNDDRPHDNVHATLTWTPVPSAGAGSQAPAPAGRPGDIQGIGEVLRRLGVLDGDPARGEDHAYVARRTLERIETMARPRPPRRWADPQGEVPLSDYEHKVAGNPSKWRGKGKDEWEAARAAAQVHQVGAHTDASRAEIKKDARAARPLGQDDFDAQGDLKDPASVVLAQGATSGMPQFIRADMDSKWVGPRRFEHRRIPIPDTYRKKAGKDGPTHIREITFRVRPIRHQGMTEQRFDAYLKDVGKKLDAMWNGRFRLRGDGTVVNDNGAVVHRLDTKLSETLFGQDSISDPKDLHGNPVTVPGADPRPGAGDQLHIRLEFADDSTPDADVHAAPTVRHYHPSTRRQDIPGMNMLSWHDAYPVEAAVHEIDHWLGLADEYWDATSVFRGRQDGDAVRLDGGHMTNSWSEYSKGRFRTTQEPFVRTAYADTIASVMEYGTSDHPAPPRAGGLNDQAKTIIARVLDPGIAATDARRFEVFDRFALATDRFVRDWDGDRVADALLSPADATARAAVREHLGVAADARAAARREQARAAQTRAAGDEAAARAAEAAAAELEKAARAADARVADARKHAADSGADTRAADALRAFDADVDGWRGDGRLARAMDLAGRLGATVPAGVVIKTLPPHALGGLAHGLSGTNDPVDGSVALTVFAAGLDRAAGRGPIADTPAGNGRPAITARDAETRLEQWRTRNLLVEGLRVLHDSGVRVEGSEWIGALPDAGRAAVVAALMPSGGPQPNSVLGRLGALQWPVLQQAALDILGARYDQLVHNQPQRGLTVSVPGHPEVRLTENQVTTQWNEWLAEGVLRPAMQRLVQLRVPVRRPGPPGGAAPAPAGPSQQQPAPQGTGAPAPLSADPQSRFAEFDPVRDAAGRADAPRNPATGTAAPYVSHRPGDPAPRAEGLPDRDRWGAESAPQRRLFSRNYIETLDPPEDDGDFDSSADEMSVDSSEADDTPPLTVEVDTPNGRMRAEVSIDNRFFESSTIEVGPDGAEDGGPSGVRNVTLRFRHFAGNGVDPEVRSAATEGLKRRIESVFNDAYVLPRSGRQLNVNVVEAGYMAPQDTVHATITWHPVEQGADGPPGTGGDGRGAGEVLRRLGMLDGDPARGVAEPYVARRTLDRIETMVEPRPVRRRPDPVGDAPAQVHGGLAHPSVWAAAREDAQVHQVGGPHFEADFYDVVTGAPVTYHLARGLHVDVDDHLRNERRFEWRRIPIPEEHRTPGGPTHVMEITFRPRLTPYPGMTDARFARYRQEYADALDSMLNRGFRLRGDGSLVRPQDGAVVHRMGTRLFETLFGEGSIPEQRDPDLRGNGAAVPGFDPLPGTGDQFHVRLEFADDDTPADQVHAEVQVLAADPSLPYTDERMSTGVWYDGVYPVKSRVHETLHFLGMVDEYTEGDSFFRWGDDADAIRPGPGLMGHNWTAEDANGWLVEAADPWIRQSYLDTAASVARDGSSAQTPPVRLADLSDDDRSHIVAFLEPGMMATDARSQEVFDHFALAVDEHVRGWSPEQAERHAADPVAYSEDRAKWQDEGRLAPMMVYATEADVDIPFRAVVDALPDAERVRLGRGLAGSDHPVARAEALAVFAAGHDHAAGRGPFTDIPATGDHPAISARDAWARLEGWRRDGRLLGAYQLLQGDSIEVRGEDWTRSLPDLARHQVLALLPRGAGLGALPPPVAERAVPAILGSAYDQVALGASADDITVTTPGHPPAHFTAQQVYDQLMAWNHQGGLADALRALQWSGVPITDAQIGAIAPPAAAQPGGPAAFTPYQPGPPGPGRPFGPGMTGRGGPAEPTPARDAGTGDAGRRAPGMRPADPAAPPAAGPTSDTAAEPTDAVRTPEAEAPERAAEDPRAPVQPAHDARRQTAPQPPSAPSAQTPPAEPAPALSDRADARVDPQGRSGTAPTPSSASERTAPPATEPPPSLAQSWGDVLNPSPRADDGTRGDGDTLRPATPSEDGADTGVTGPDPAQAGTTTTDDARSPVVDPDEGRTTVDPERERELARARKGKQPDRAGAERAEAEALAAEAEETRLRAETERELATEAEILAAEAAVGDVPTTSSRVEAMATEAAIRQVDAAEADRLADLMSDRAADARRRAEAAEHDAVREQDAREQDAPAAEHGADTESGAPLRSPVAPEPPAGAEPPVDSAAPPVVRPRSEAPERDTERTAPSKDPAVTPRKGDKAGVRRNDTSVRTDAPEAAVPVPGDRPPERRDGASERSSVDVAARVRDLEGRKATPPPPARDDATAPPQGGDTTSPRRPGDGDGRVAARVRWIEGLSDASRSGNGGGDRRPAGTGRGTGGRSVPDPQTTRGGGRRLNYLLRSGQIDAPLIGPAADRLISRIRSEISGTRGDLSGRLTAGELNAIERQVRADTARDARPYFAPGGHTFTIKGRGGERTVTLKLSPEGDSWHPASTSGSAPATTGPDSAPSVKTKSTAEHKTKDSRKGQATSTAAVGGAFNVTAYGLVPADAPVAGPVFTFSFSGTHNQRSTSYSVSDTVSSKSEVTLKGTPEEFMSALRVELTVDPPPAGRQGPADRVRDGDRTSDVELTENAVVVSVVEPNGLSMSVPGGLKNRGTAADPAKDAPARIVLPDPFDSGPRTPGTQDTQGTRVGSGHPLAVDPIDGLTRQIRQQLGIDRDHATSADLDDVTTPDALREILPSLDRGPAPVAVVTDAEGKTRVLTMWSAPRELTRIEDAPDKASFSRSGKGDKEAGLAAKRSTNLKIGVGLGAMVTLLKGVLRFNMPHAEVSDKLDAASSRAINTGGGRTAKAHSDKVETYEVDRVFYATLSGDRTLMRSSGRSIEQIAVSDARRMAGLDEPTPQAAARRTPRFDHLTVDRPAHWGATTPREVLHRDGSRYRTAPAPAPVTGGPAQRPRTVYEEYARAVLTGIADQHPGLVVPDLDTMAKATYARRPSAGPDDRRTPRERWLLRRDYEQAVANTIEILKAITGLEQHLEKRLDEWTGPGVDVHLIETTSIDPTLASRGGFFRPPFVTVRLHADATGRTFGGTSTVGTGSGVSGSAGHTDGRDRTKTWTEQFVIGTQGRDPAADATGLRKNIGMFNAVAEASQPRGRSQEHGVKGSTETSVTTEGDTDVWRWDLNLTAKIAKFRKADDLTVIDDGGTTAAAGPDGSTYDGYAVTIQGPHARLEVESAAGKDVDPADARDTPITGTDRATTAGGTTGRTAEGTRAPATENTPAPATRTRRASAPAASTGETTDPAPETASGGDTAAAPAGPRRLSAADARALVLGTGRAPAPHPLDGVPTAPERVTAPDLYRLGNRLLTDTTPGFQDFLRRSRGAHDYLRQLLLSPTLSGNVPQLLSRFGLRSGRMQVDTSWRWRGLPTLVTRAVRGAFRLHDPMPTTTVEISSSGELSIGATSTHGGHTRSLAFSARFRHNPNDEAPPGAEQPPVGTAKRANPMPGVSWTPYSRSTTKSTSDSVTVSRTTTVGPQGGSFPYTADLSFDQAAEAKKDWKLGVTVPRRSSTATHHGVHTEAPGGEFGYIAEAEAYAAGLVDDAVGTDTDGNPVPTRLLGHDALQPDWQPRSGFSGLGHRREGPDPGPVVDALMRRLADEGLELTGTSREGLFQRVGEHLSRGLDDATARAVPIDVKVRSAHTVHASRSGKITVDVIRQRSEVDRVGAKADFTDSRSRTTDVTESAGRKKETTVGGEFTVIGALPHDGDARPASEAPNSRPVSLPAGGDVSRTGGVSTTQNTGDSITESADTTITGPYAVMGTDAALRLYLEVEGRDDAIIAEAPAGRMSELYPAPYLVRENGSGARAPKAGEPRVLPSPNQRLDPAAQDWTAKTRRRATESAPMPWLEALAVAGDGAAVTAAGYIAAARASGWQPPQGASVPELVRGAREYLVDTMGPRAENIPAALTGLALTANFTPASKSGTGLPNLYRDRVITFADLKWRLHAVPRTRGARLIDVSVDSGHGGSRQGGHKDETAVEHSASTSGGVTGRVIGSAPNQNWPVGSANDGQSTSVSSTAATAKSTRTDHPNRPPTSSRRAYLVAIPTTWLVAAESPVAQIRYMGFSADQLGMAEVDAEVVTWLDHDQARQLGLVDGVETNKELWDALYTAQEKFGETEKTYFDARQKLPELVRSVEEAHQSGDPKRLSDARTAYSTQRKKADGLHAEFRQGFEVWNAARNTARESLELSARERALRDARLSRDVGRTQDARAAYDAQRAVVDRLRTESKRAYDDWDKVRTKPEPAKESTESTTRATDSPESAPPAPVHPHPAPPAADSMMSGALPDASALGNDGGPTSEQAEAEARLRSPEPPSLDARGRVRMGFADWDTDSGDEDSGVFRRPDESGPRDGMASFPRPWARDPWQTETRREYPSFDSPPTSPGGRIHAEAFGEDVDSADDLYLPPVELRRAGPYTAPTGNEAASPNGGGDDGPPPASAERPSAETKQRPAPVPGEDDAKNGIEREPELPLPSAQPSRRPPSVPEPEPEPEPASERSAEPSARQDPSAPVAQEPAQRPSTTVPLRTEPTTGQAESSARSPLAPQPERGSSYTEVFGSVLNPAGATPRGPVAEPEAPAETTRAATAPAEGAAPAVPPAHQAAPPADDPQEGRDPDDTEDSDDSDSDNDPDDGDDVHGRFGRRGDDDDDDDDAPAPGTGGQAPASSGSTETSRFGGGRTDGGGGGRSAGPAGTTRGPDGVNDRERTAPDDDADGGDLYASSPEPSPGPATPVDPSDPWGGNPPVTPNFSALADPKSAKEQPRTIEDVVADLTYRYGIEDIGHHTAQDAETQVFMAGHRRRHRSSRHGQDHDPGPSDPYAYQYDDAGDPVDDAYSQAQYPETQDTQSPWAQTQYSQVQYSRYPAQDSGPVYPDTTAHGSAETSPQGQQTPQDPDQAQGGSQDDQIEVLRGWNRTFAGIEDLVAATGSEVVGRQAFTAGGSDGSTELMRFDNGTQAVYKDTEEATRARDRADAEQLASLVGRAIGANVPGVLRVGEFEMFIHFMNGVSGTTHIDNPRPPLTNTHDGHVLGLLDLLIANGDRNPGNWLDQGNGHVAGIDHGKAWFKYEYTPEDPTDLDGLAYTHGMRPFYDFDANEWIANPLTRADIRLLRTRLAALHNEFVRLDRAEWFDEMMARFDMLARNARGTTNLLAGGRR